MAGLAKGLFGRRETGPVFSATLGTDSLYALAVQQGGVTSRKCGVKSCGSTFPSSKAVIHVITSNPDRWKLDVSGYCPKCRMYRCPRHARLSSINTVQGDVTVYMITICCNTCRTVLDVAP
jgi:hypothetical protein